LNGIDMGNILYSHHACSNIIAHIAADMLRNITQCIVSFKVRFSIMIDGSTSVSNVQFLIAYARFVFESEVCTYFLGLLPISTATAAGIKELLINFLHSIDLTDDILRNQLIGFCSDGASIMIGEHRGVASLLKADYPLVNSFHCMTHRLELAVKDSTESMKSVTHFTIFVNDLYKVFSLSPKNQRELSTVAEDLTVELMKVQRVFDVRWVFSSFVAVKAVLRNLSALFQYFTACASTESGRPSKERSKFKGLVNKLQQWRFVCEAAMLKDALRTLP
jgi:hypothetical protein